MQCVIRTERIQELEWLPESHFIISFICALAVIRGIKLKPILLYVQR